MKNLVVAVSIIAIIFVIYAIDKANVSICEKLIGMAKTRSDTVTVYSSRPSDHSYTCSYYLD